MFFIVTTTYRYTHEFLYLFVGHLILHNITELVYIQTKIRNYDEIYILKQLYNL